MSQRFFCAVIILLCFVFYRTFGQTPAKYECKPGSSPNKCYLSIFTSSSMKNFDLTINDKQKANNITWFWFYLSTVRILTSDFCRALPHIRNYGARNVHMVAIDADAFQHCLSLKEVDLDNNKLEKLPTGLFAFNAELTRVSLGGNKLTTLDENLFQNNRQLSGVELQNNLLGALPVNLFRNNKKVRILYLQNNLLTKVSIKDEMPVLLLVNLANNNISSTDLEDLVGKCPNMRLMLLNGNELLKSEYVEEIKSTLSNRNFSVTTRTNLLLKRSAVVSGTVVLILVLGIGGYWIVKRLRRQDVPNEDQTQQEEIPLPFIDLSRFNVPVERDDPYYEYVEGFNDNRNSVARSSRIKEKAQKPKTVTLSNTEYINCPDIDDTYDHLDFTRQSS